ncbi:MAG: hypothetical protein R3E66_15535 [bacterium]
MNVQTQSKHDIAGPINPIFAPMNLETFEVTDAYTYFDYAHEELLAARFHGQEIAVGTLMIYEPGEDESSWCVREPAVILDRKRGAWLVARMFDGFDADVWEDAERLRLAVAEEIAGSVGLVALVLGTPRDHIVVPDRLSGVVFAENELASLSQMVLQTPVQSEAERTCQAMLEIGDFIDAKQNDMREIPRWLWLELVRDSAMAKEL